MSVLKYLIASADNAFQINLRNLLNPCGYSFLSHCKDSISLLRTVRSYQPDFVIIDLNMPLRDLKSVLETIDGEMLCFSILVGEQKEMEITSLMKNSWAISFCEKSFTRELLVNTIEMSELNFERVSLLNKKLKEVTENYETRKLVERAKWILMERDGISESEAYEKMRKKSMDSRITMKAIAEAVIFTYELGAK